MLSPGAGCTSSLRGCSLPAFCLAALASVAVFGLVYVCLMLANGPTWSLTSHMLYPSIGTVDRLVRTMWAAVGLYDARPFQVPTQEGAVLHMLAPLPPGVAQLHYGALAILAFGMPAFMASAVVRRVLRRMQVQCGECGLYAYVLSSTRCPFCDAVLRARNAVRVKSAAGLPRQRAVCSDIRNACIFVGLVAVLWLVYLVLVDGTRRLSLQPMLWNPDTTCVKQWIDVKTVIIEAIKDGIFWGPAIVVTLIGTNRHFWEQVRSDQPRCPACGYITSPGGIAKRCPECGSRFSDR